MAFNAEPFRLGGKQFADLARRSGRSPAKKEQPAIVCGGIKFAGRSRFVVMIVFEDQLTDVSAEVARQK